MVSVSVTGNNWAGTNYFTIEVGTTTSNYVPAARSFTSNYYNLAGSTVAIVPPNHYYRFTASGANSAYSVNLWSELR
jgi:hypothetical protein